MLDFQIQPFELRATTPPHRRQSIVSSLGFKGRGSSSGFNGFAPRSSEQSSSRGGNFRGRGRGCSITRGLSSTRSRASRSGTGFGQQQCPRFVKCFNCQKIGHYARDCRNRSCSGVGQGQGSVGNWRERHPKSRPHSNFKHRVSALNTASEQDFIEEEGELAEASGYTANGISSADVKRPDKPSALYQSRKLLGFLALSMAFNAMVCLSTSVPVSR